MSFSYPYAQLTDPVLVVQLSTQWLKERKEQLKGLDLCQTLFITNEEFDHVQITFANSENHEFVDIFCGTSSVLNSKDLYESLTELLRVIEERKLAETKAVQ